jgi:hypothetical protein
MAPTVPRMMIWPELELTPAQALLSQNRANHLSIAQVIVYIVFHGVSGERHATRQARTIRELRSKIRILRRGERCLAGQFTPTQHVSLDRPEGETG